MLHILFISSDKYLKSVLETCFDDFKEVKLKHTVLADEALLLITEKPYDLVITDERLPDMTGLEFIRKMIQKNPMINSAVVSSMDSEKFHEESEGLGVLMQIPVRPRKKDIEKLLKQMAEITRISAL